MPLIERLRQAADLERHLASLCQPGTYSEEHLRRFLMCRLVDDITFTHEERERLHSAHNVTLQYQFLSLAKAEIRRLFGVHRGNEMLIKYGVRHRLVPRLEFIEDDMQIFRAAEQAVLDSLPR